MDWRPVGLSFLVIILHAISAVAHPHRYIRPFLTHFIGYCLDTLNYIFPYVNNVISPFCENDRLYKKRNVSFPIFVRCHHSFIK